MQVKICGITNLPDAQFCVQQGVWGLGFNFYAQSPRYINPEQAKVIIDGLPTNIKKIGVFVGETLLNIRHIQQQVGLDYIQIYQDFTELTALEKTQTIRAVQLSALTDIEQIKNVNSYYALLLDAPKTNDGLYGGTGRVVDWQLAHQLAQQYRVFLAGGLTPHNVAQAVQAVQPFGLDVASGVEATPQQKDHTKIINFIKAIESN
jgi:phosphoribosylanthranilate isomerase